MSRYAIAHAADRWLVAEAGGETLDVDGYWGRAHGSITAPAGLRRGASLGQRLFGGRVKQTATLALVVPHPPGIESAERLAVMDDALCTALLHAGARVARFRQIDLAVPPFNDAASYADACTDLVQAARCPGARPAIAGSWLAGAMGAIVAGRREDLAFAVLVCAPAPEVMSRRSPENEDDPMWTASPTLRLADALAALAPMEAIATYRRPVLIMQGAVDSGLSARHLDAWRGALAGAGKPVDAIELACTNELLHPVQPDGTPDDTDPASLDLAAETIAQWVSRV